MCRPRCDIGVRAGERAVAEPSRQVGGVLGRAGEDEEPGSGGDEEKGGGKRSLAALDGSDGPAFGDDGCVERALANARGKSSRLVTWSLVFRAESSGDLCWVEGIR
jgi:hypothetical protein